ncbi:MAG: carboxypeptidase-like regulatory domain-containing protein [bacterium]
MFASARASSLALIALLGLAVPPAARAGLDPAAQQCVRRLAENTLAIATVQASQNLACLRGGVDAQACLSADANGRLAAAAGQTLVDVRQRCGTFPPFGAPQRLSETAVAAGVLHERGLVADLFGLDLQHAVAAAGADERSARCQRTVLHRAEDLMRARLNGYLRCARQALPTAADAAALAVCVERSTAAATRARAVLARAVTERCAGLPAATLFPGRCGTQSGAALAACVAERAACRSCRLLDSTAALGIDCDFVDDDVDNDSCRIPVSISGNAIPFNGSDSRIAGAEISILEHPERRVVTTADGAFAFDDLEEGSEATLVLSHPDYHAIQTGTIRLGPQGASRVTFQGVTHPIYAALATFLAVTPDPSRCQIVTTVTRLGRSLYDPGAHGEAGAIVDLQGATPGEGPIYFNSSVLPERALLETSDDGGVLFVDAPLGEYRWTATKPGAAFSSLTMKCRPDVLVNASPPWGLQRQ